MDAEIEIYIFDILQQFKVKDDGTYNVNTGDAIEYDNGYQVTFVRPEAFEQLDKYDWEKITNYYCDYFKSDAHIGVYCGDAEVSFHSISLEKSIKVMEEFNQESILDWEQKMNNPENIQSWFIINRLFDESKVLDYEEIFNKIQ